MPSPRSARWQVALDPFSCPKPPASTSRHPAPGEMRSHGYVALTRFLVHGIPAADLLSPADLIRVMRVRQDTRLALGMQGSAECNEGA